MADATLYWPPALRLYEELSTSSANADRLEETCKRYRKVLIDGLSLFKGQDSQCRKVVQEQSTVFASNGPKVPIRAELKEAALALSGAVGLNEAQAYLVVWRLREQSSFRGAGRDERTRLLVHTYFEERQYVLGCWETLMQLRIGDEDDQAAPILIDTANELISESGRDRLLQHIKDSFPYESAPAGLPGGDALMAQSVSYSWQEELDQQHMREACTLMELLLLADGIVAGPAAPHEAPWPPPSFLHRAQLLNTLFLAAHRPPELLMGAEQQRADHLAAILLLQALDLQQLLTLCADGEPALDAALKAGKGGQVDSELQRWLHAARPEQGPILLAWGAASLLVQTLCPGSQHLSSAASAFGTKAWELHALQQMAGMLLHPGMQPEGPLASLCRRPMQCLLSLVLIAVSLQPASTPPAEMDAIAQCLEGIFDGQPELCLEVWAEAPAAEAVPAHAAPLRHWLHSLRSLFPGHAGPYLRALRCLSSSPASAISADMHLKAATEVACLHEERALAQGSAPERGSGGRLWATAWLPAAGLHGVVIPEGTVGVRLPSPYFARATGDGEAVDARCLVAWRGFAGVGHHHLLCIVQTALMALQQAAEDSRMGAHHANDIRNALTELGPPLRLLARFAAEAPAVILELAHSTAIPDADGESITLAVLLVRTASVLSSLSTPPAELIGDCLLILAAAAINMAAHVKAEASSIHLLEVLQPGGSGLSGLGTHAELPMLESDMPALQQLQRHAEAVIGRYPVTSGFLTMLHALLAAGIADGAIQGWVGFAIGHLLPDHRNWTYAKAADRWELSAMLLGILHAALTCQGLPAEGVTDLRAAVAEALSQPGAASSCLATSLPPDAGTLQHMLLHGQAGEVAVAQACAMAWLEVLPELLPASSLGPSAGTLAAFLMQVPAPGVPAPATTLASYIALPDLSTRQRATALTALAAMSEACAGMSNLSFAGCLPEGPDGKVDEDLRMQLVACFEPEVADGEPELLAAATKLAVSAIHHHPSLVDVLCFPTSLKLPAPDGKENQAAGAQPAALPTIAEGKPAAGGKPAEGATSQSCLDGVCSLLTQVATLHSSCPAALAQALHLLLALCEAGGTAARPLHLLRGQTGLWDHLLAAACMGAAEPGTPEARRVEKGRHEDDGSQAERCWDAWRLQAQAHATRILALSAYLPGCQRALVVWKGKGSGDLLEKLLKQLLPDVQQATATPRTLQRTGLQAVAELVVLSMSEPSLEQRLAMRGSMLGGLHALTSRALAEQMTDAKADSLLAMHDRLSSSEAIDLVDSSPEGGLASQLLQSGVVTALLTAAASRQAAAGGGPAPGGETSAVYDADRVARMVGPLYVERLGSCSALMQALRHASTAAFQEQARLQALQAVAALLTVLQRLPESKPGLELGSAAAIHVNKTLSAALSSFLTASLGGSLQPVTRVHGHDWGVHLLQSIVSLTQVLLIVVRHVCDSRTAVDDLPVSELGSRLELAAQVFLLCRAWLAGRGSVASWCPDQELPAAVTRALMASAVLLALHVHVEPRHAPQQQHSSYQAAAGLLLPLLCGCAAAGPHDSPGPDPCLALATILLRSCQTALDQSSPTHSHMQRMLQRTAWALGQTQAPWVEPAAMQALLLCQALAQQPGASALLAAADVLPAVLHVARLLLGREASGLQAADAPADSSSPEPPDWSGAYTRAGQPSQAHRQWLAILSILGSLLRVQPDSQPVADAALALVITGQDRLLAAVAPPAGSADQPLTLAGLQECERAAFLLSGMARLAGAWQAALPGCMAAARRAAAAFTALAALPSFRASFSIRCPPVSPDEKASAEAPAPVLQLLDGWFAVCADGSSSSNSSAHGSSLAGSSRSPSRRPGRHITWSSAIPSSPHSPRSPRHERTGEFGSAVSMSLEPRGSSLHRRLSRSPEASVKSMSVDLHSRRDSGAGSPSPMRQLSPNPQRSSAAAAAGVGISRHAAALADGMYAAAAQSLSLLCSLAPEVSEEEAAAGALGPEWPAPEVLRALQRQCVDISHAAQSREHSPCAKRLIMSLLATLHGTNCLLDRMHYFPTRSQSGERLAAEQAVERLQRAAGAYERESA